jgi:hypothetical protein
MKSGSGPWAKYQAETDAKAEAPSTGAGRAFGEGLTDAATLGYKPQIEAAGTKIALWIGDKLNGTRNSELMPYTKLRDDSAAAMAETKSAHPIAATAGQVAGSLIPAGLLAKTGGKLGIKAAQTVGGRIAQAAQGGAILGFAQNPGDTEGQLAPIQLDDRTSNAKTGFLLGALAQGVGEGGKKLLDAARSSPSALKKFAETRGAAATGMSKSGAKKLIKADPSGMEGKQIQEIGRFALDNGLVKPGDAIEDVARKSGQFKKEVGQRIGKIYQAADDALKDPAAIAGLSPEKIKRITDTSFDPKRMAQNFLDSFSAEMRGKAGGEQALRAVEAEVRNFASNPNGKVGILDVQDFKEGLDDIIFTADKNPSELTPVKNALKSFRDFLKDKIEDHLGAVDDAFGQKLGADLKALNREYGLAAKVNRTARDRLAGDLGNNFFSLTDKIAGIGGTVAGGVQGYEQGGIEGAAKGAALGAGLGLASKVARSYGRPIVTHAADKTASALMALPDLTGLVARLTPPVTKRPELLTTAVQGTRAGGFTPKPAYAESKSEDDRKPSAMRRRLEQKR